MNKFNLNNFWEIDFSRGMAIIMMIVYHFFYDLDFLKIAKVNLESGFFNALQITTASLFILLVGICLSLSYGKAKIRSSEMNLFGKFLKRGLKVFLLGMMITLITKIFLKEGFVVFGILHFIGMAIILSYPFLRLGNLKNSLALNIINLILGIIFILIGKYLETLNVASTRLLWLGFKPDNFYSVDYFPILPWFGLVLTGIFLGNIFYANNERKFFLPNLEKLRIVKFLAFAGKHSLLIYLVHQPIMAGILLLIKK